MLSRLSQIVALVAALGYASVAYGQAKTAYNTEGMVIQIGLVSGWGHDQCGETNLANPCMKEALQLIQEMHTIIVRMNEFNTSPSIAKRDMIQRNGPALMDRVDQWVERYKIRAVRVSTQVTK